MRNCSIREDLGNSSKPLVLLSYHSTPNFTRWKDIDSEDLMNAIHTCCTVAANQQVNFIAVGYVEVHIRTHSCEMKIT